ncbi:MAG: methyltransferase [Planctomycetota bacterium]
MVIVQFRSLMIERAIKSVTFSIVLFCAWGWVAFQKGKGMLVRYDAVELAWFGYNIVIAVLFLIRTRPTIVSLDPVHWLVALTASFSGFFFHTYDVSLDSWHGRVGSALIITGILSGIIVGLSLGRSYDFLPALRGVQTGWAYRWVRHPMYVSSIVIRLGYLCVHPSLFNLVVFAVMLELYVIRSNIEEAVMLHDPQYRTYLEKVRWKFIPGLH